MTRIPMMNQQSWKWFFGIALGAVSAYLACSEPVPMNSGPVHGSGSTSTSDVTTNGGAGGASGAGTASPRNTGGINLSTGTNSPGTGGAGSDDAAPPSADANCGVTDRETKRTPVDVLLVLDRSGSMAFSTAQDCYCAAADVTSYGSLCSDTTNCTTRWSAVKSAVTATLSNSSYVEWGLKFFPSAGAGQNCTVNSTMEVPISATSATDVESAVNGANYDYSTPTAAALKAATAYLKTLNDGNKKFILLATDGVPNCGGNPASSATSDLPGATSAAAAAVTAGYKVYVVGIGPNLNNLTQLAQNGGTTDFYPVASPQDLADALSSISKLVGSCSFKADQVPPDEANVAVYVNKNKVDQSATNGWKFGANSQEIILTGDYCSQATSGDGVDVQILFGCPYYPQTIL